MTDPQKRQQLEQKIDQTSEKMLAQLTNQNRTVKQIQKQFFFMAKNHEKYPFMSQVDLDLFRSSLKDSQVINFTYFCITGATSVGLYKLAGGFTPSSTSPWLRRFRHFSAIGIPALFLPLIITSYFPSKGQENIKDLSIKYREKLLDVEFNKKFISDQSEKFKKQKLSK